MTSIFKNTYFVLSVILLLLMGSCISPITPRLNATDSKGLLVVDSQITDQQGPFIVKLSTTVPANVVYTPVPVLNANVHITDDRGNSFQLPGDSNGSYKTADTTLRGIPGNTYTLFITTPDSVQYISSPVLMQDVPGIDSVYFEQVAHTRFSQGQTYSDDWLNILLDTHDADAKTKYWQFAFEETWEVNMISDHVKVQHDPNNLSNFDWEKIDISDNKKICWVTKPSASIIIASTANQPVDELKRFPIEAIGPGEDRLHIRYSILVKQYAISADIYNYWKQMMDTNSNLDDIYSKIPSPVFGNITSRNGTAKALGYFSASAVKEKRLFILRSEHQVETVPVNNGCTYFDYDMPSGRQESYFGPEILTGTKVYSFSTGCTDCTQYGTNVKPSFW
jgi:hypothetical protein